MPIVFAPAQPLAPGVSAGYGAAMQGQEDFSRILAAQQAAVQAQNERARLGIEAAQQASQASGGGGGIMANAGKAAEIALQQNQLAMEGGRLNIEAAKPLYAADMANLQASNEQIQVSQAERMQAQKLQNAIGYINSQDNLSPEVKQDLLTQAQTKLSPLNAKIKQFEAQQQQVKFQNDMRQATHLAALQSADQATRAQAMQSRTVTPVGPDGQPLTDANGQPLTGWIDHKGDYQAYDRGKGTPDNSEKVLLQQQQNYDKLALAHKKAFGDALMKANQMVTGWAAQDTKAGKETPYVGAKYDETVAGLVRGLVGANTLGEHMQNFQNQYGPRPTGSERPQTRGVPAQRGEVPTPQSTVAQAQKDQPPITNPKKATPLQNNMLGLMDLTQKKIMQSPMPVQQKLEWSAHLSQMQAMLHKYGSPEGMPTDTRQRYLDMMEQLKKIGTGRTSVESAGGFTPFDTAPSPYGR